MAFSALHIVAQEMKVLSFVRAETDMTATNNRILDVNDRVCALIKVETSESGISFTFGTSQIVKREEQNTEHPSEIWLYVPPGVTKVTIQKSGYPVIRDYPLSEMLQSGRTYIMKLTCDKVVSYVETSVSGQFVSFIVSPADAYLEFDDKPLQLKKGQASTANPVSFGVYSYKVEAENYHPENGKIDVNDPDNSIIVNVTLKPAYGSIEVSGESARGGTVYLDKKYVGTAPVSLEIVPSGKHTVKVAKDMYNPYEEEIDIKDGENTLVTPIMHPNFQNITFKADGNAEIWINGKLRGTGYVKDDFEAGTLFVECKKENHRTTSANYPSVAGALPTTITLASPIPIYGVLLVKSNPIGADVFVDGENKGKTPRQLAQTIIGLHKVRILKEGYLPYEETVTILEGQAKTVDVDLDNMIQVSFSCNAGHIPLKVDGVNIGYADESCNITIGKHQIECIADGYNPYNETIDVISDTRRHSIVMESIVVNLTLSKSTISAKASGESFKINVSTDANQWEIANKPSWCEYTDKTKNSFTLILSPNNDFHSRYGNVEVLAGKKRESIYITQQGKPYKNKQPITTFVGLNLGIGYQDNAAFQNLNGSLGIDLAWGRYYNAYGMFLSYMTIDNISFGPLFIFNHFVMGFGANVNVGRNVYSELPYGVTARKINMGYDGVLRLGGRFGRVYMFAEGGLGMVSGIDKFYNDLTRRKESHEWNKLNWTASLGLGVQVCGNVAHISTHSRSKVEKKKKGGSEYVTRTIYNKSSSSYKFIKEKKFLANYYDNCGDYCITWVKFSGVGGYVNYFGKYKVEYGNNGHSFILGGTIDWFAFRIRIFELSLLSATVGFDFIDYDFLLAHWSPRFRLNIPVWDSGSIYSDIGILGKKGLYGQIGIQWMFAKWGLFEAFLKTDCVFDAYRDGVGVGGVVVSAGFSLGLCTGWN